MPLMCLLTQSFSLALAGAKQRFFTTCCSVTSTAINSYLSWKIHVFSEVSGKSETGSGYIYTAGTTPSQAKAQRCIGVEVEIIRSGRPAAVTLLRVRVAKS